MEKLLFPKDVAARYQVSIRTARRYMHFAEHQDPPGPLAVTEAALEAWEASRTVPGYGSAPAAKKRRYNAAPVEFKMPRKRPT